MDYEQWRDELFGQPPDFDPVMVEHSRKFYYVPPEQAFDYIDRILVDRDGYSMFTKEQFGNGLNYLFSNSCSDLPFLYTTECSEARQLKEIRGLINLYRNSAYDFN